MRKTSPAQLALIDLPSGEDLDGRVGGGRVGDIDLDLLEAARAEALRTEVARAEAAERARREAQAVVNVQQCQALLETIARVPPAGVAVPTTRPSARPRRRAHVEERRVRQLAELYAAFERAQAPGQGAARPAAANDDRRQRGRGARVA